MPKKLAKTDEDAPIIVSEAEQQNMFMKHKIDTTMSDIAKRAAFETLPEYV